MDYLGVYKNELMVQGLRVLGSGLQGSGLGV